MNSLRILLLNFFLLEIKAETCPMLYQRYSQIHTFCLPPKETCNIIRSNVSAIDKDIILREHNMYRSKMATGQNNYSFPQASNMLEMVWNEELAALAQKHSDQCAFRHDCNECRRIKNFDVGQNLFERLVSPNPLPPDWKLAIKSWNDEVQDYNKTEIDSFQDTTGERPIGHFTQMVWATTWMIGCGFTLNLEETGYYKGLYVCNYGPAGNIKDEPLYKKGQPCSGCPINSCCGKSCPEATYSGLCQISGNKAPQYKRPGGSLFLCTFNNEPDCARTTSGVDGWKVTETLSGSYIGIVLNGGESSTLNFTKPFKGQKTMCLTSHFRKGPQKAGQEGNNAAYEVVRIPDANFDFRQEMESNSVDFIKLSITLNWHFPTMLSIKFEVPEGAYPQYLEMKDIEVREGQCS